MRATSISFALSLALAPASAWTQPAGTVALAPDEGASFHLDAAGAIADTAVREPATWRPIDVVAGRQLAGTPIPDAPVPNSTPVIGDPGALAAPPVEPNVVHVKFLSIAGRHSLLVVENGYDRAIFYRARITSHGRSQLTDVCIVTPHYRTFEHWPYPIDRMEISEMRFVDWKGGDTVPCA